MKKITLPNEIFGSDSGSFDCSTDQATTGDVNSPTDITNRFKREDNGIGESDTEKDEKDVTKQRRERKHRLRRRFRLRKRCMERS
jgi:hypothetical protein